MNAFNVQTMIGRNIYAEDLLVIARNADEAQAKAIRHSIKINNGVKTSSGHAWRVTSVVERNETVVR